jgi:hypothetical protein
MNDRPAGPRPISAFSRCATRSAITVVPNRPIRAIALFAIRVEYPENH